MVYNQKFTKKTQRKERLEERLNGDIEGGIQLLCENVKMESKKGANHMNKRERESQRLKILLVVFLILSILLGAILGIVAFGEKMYNQMDHEALVLDEGETLIDEELLSLKKDSGVVNIALFGVDARQNTYEGTRSDAMMVLSYNGNAKEASVTSIVRDTYAWINDDYGYDKINHAYSFGGPALAIQTLNKNFDLDIEYYIAVNFNAVQEIIDAIGGVEVEVEDYEINEVNRVIREMKTQGVFQTAPEIPYTGVQTLNGQQALAYMRIRKVGNGDWERMERQREVLNVMFEQVKNMKKTELVALAQELLPYIKTNLPFKEAVALGTDILLNGLTSLNQYQLPSTEESLGKKLSDGIYYLIPRTLEENVEEWHRHVYKDENYQVTSGVQTISDQIVNRTGLY